MIYSARYVLRLCWRRSIFTSQRFNQFEATNGQELKENGKKTTFIKKFSEILKRNSEKITFSSYLEHEKLELGYFKYHLKALKQAKRSVKKEYKDKCLTPLPVSLQYYVDKERLLKDENELCEVRSTTTSEEKTFQLPFAQTTRVQETEKEQNVTEESESEFDRTNIKKWMTNYEHFDDSQLDPQDEAFDEEEYSWNNRYGTPNPSLGVSNVPCGGCGALLHSCDPAIPGYLPSEIFQGRDKNQLKTIECQRCHFLKEYNIALDVSVHPEEYEKLLQSIRYVKSLVLLMVDLLDFPCSIWPGIVDIIGKDRPIILVGNKVDLLPGDSIGYLKRIKESFVTEINKTKLSEANVKHIALISAKTGYGVEDLISAMFKYWLGKGDVFLVGCTNVGKSSLFNALILSDYCKVHAVDIVRRATVSRWPGTTLNLLKFPINRPSGWKIYERTKRLKSETRMMKFEKEIRKAQLQGQPNVEAPALIGHIGRTFADPRFDDNTYIGEKKDFVVLDERHELFKNSKWFYDTPGVIHPDQVLSLLSTEELLITIPKNIIKPQTYYLHKGETIFIGGLARIDFLNCDYPCRFTIFCSESLPITVTKTEDADHVYDEFVGTDLFGVPLGGEERLKTWPGLSKSTTLLEFEGEGPKFGCGDIVLSSVAWLSVTAKKGSTCKLVAWTPEARGVYKRYPSVLPYAVNLKGKRIRNTPAYTVGNVFSEE